MTFSETLLPSPSDYGKVICIVKDASKRSIDIDMGQLLDVEGFQGVNHRFEDRNESNNTTFGG